MLRDRDTVVNQEVCSLASGKLQCCGSITRVQRQNAQALAAPTGYTWTPSFTQHLQRRVIVKSGDLINVLERETKKGPVTPSLSLGY